MRKVFSKMERILHQLLGVQNGAADTSTAWLPDLTTEPLALSRLQPLPVLCTLGCGIREQSPAVEPHRPELHPGTATPRR